jgi:hypothetical protein
MADLVWSDPDPDKEDFAISPRLDSWFTHKPILSVQAAVNFGIS